MNKYSIILFSALFILPVDAQENQLELTFPKDTVFSNAIPWQSYSLTDNSSHIVLFYTDGYRVSLGTVEIESDAFMIKRELKYRIGIDLLYIYKEKDKYLLRVGDFTDIGSARQMMFQLIQLGYTQARVVEDKVYTF